MNSPASIKAMRRAAAEGDLPELRRLLAADPGLADPARYACCTPLWCAACLKRWEAFRLLLEVAPKMKLTTNVDGDIYPLQPHLVSSYGFADAAALRLLLEAVPEAARAAENDGMLPLHKAAFRGSAMQSGC